MIFSNQLYYNINILINSEMKQLIKVFQCRSYCTAYNTQARVREGGGEMSCYPTPRI